MKNKPLEAMYAEAKDWRTGKARETGALGYVEVCVRIIKAAAERGLQYPGDADCALTDVIRECDDALKAMGTVKP